MSVITWTHNKGDSYLAIGRDAYGKRFRITTSSWLTMRCYNFYEARIYHVNGTTGKRKLLQTVTP